MTTIRCILNDTALVSKNQPGIIQGDRLVLYSEWNDFAGAVADRLVQTGIRPGDRVALFMANDWRQIVILTGIMRAGAVACPLSTRLPRQGVVAHMKQVDCRHIVAFLSDRKGGELEGLTVLSPDELLATPDQGARNVPPLDLDAPALIVFTSGSSGVSRPAVLSYGNLYYNAHGSNTNIRVHSNDRWLLNLPTSHVSGIGIIFRCMLAGASIIVPEDAEDLTTALTRYKPTHLSLVPTQLADWLDMDLTEACSRVRVFLVGGSACEPRLVERARERQWPIYLTYGMTETGSQIATMPVDAPPTKRSMTSGKPLRHRTVRLADNGEILVRGPCLFKGYWTDGGLELPVDAEGWFHTGDLGHLDADGYLQVLGRMDAMIISGGENIQPDEIETLLRAMDGVKQVMVVPVKHARFGQRPVAFVDADSWDELGWRKNLLQVLPSFKVPDAFYPWPEDIPSIGIKPSRQKLTERAEQKR
jgi:O-succinylbenzoic acid--CoA ligase